MKCFKCFTKETKTTTKKLLTFVHNGNARTCEQLITDKVILLHCCLLQMATTAAAAEENGNITAKQQNRWTASASSEKRSRNRPDSTSWDLQEEAEKLGYSTKTDNYWVKYQHAEREIWPGAWSKPERYIGHGLWGGDRTKPPELLGCQEDTVKICKDHCLSHYENEYIKRLEKHG